MRFRTGTLHIQKLAHPYGRATSSSCLLCHQPDSQIHMLSGCQNASNQNMVTERHNIASKLIIKILTKVNCRRLKNNTDRAHDSFQDPPGPH